MKNFAIGLFAVLLMIACKKEDDLDPTRPLQQRIIEPGWTITEIEYSGFAPNPLDTTQIIPFSGYGEDVKGYFLFQENPNEGEFDIEFISKINLGLSQPVSFLVTETHRGFYEIHSNETYVKMWRNDTIFDWKVEVNQEKKQTWSTGFLYEFKLTPTSSVKVPISVKATMVR